MKILLMAHFLLTCSVIIGEEKFNRVNEIVVKSSWEELVDTCIIKLPLLRGKIDKDNAQLSLADRLKEGDRVSVTMGYVGLNKTYSFNEFNGFVKRVSPNVPLEVECEDACFLLRKTNLSKAWRETTLKEVVSYIVDEVNVKFAGQYKVTLSSKIPEVNMSKFRLDNVNGLDALNKIKEEYGLVAYFRDLELFVGLAFTQDNETVKYSLAWNIIESDLTYRKADEIKIQLRAISMLKDNKQLKVEVGESGGEIRTQYYNNITDKATLEKLAKQDIEKLRYEGFEGGFKSFLVPFVRHSMIVDLQDPDYENRSGKYIVNAVETTFADGITRDVTIGRRV